jgi:hypothetical protein
MYKQTQKNYQNALRDNLFSYRKNVNNVIYIFDIILTLVLLQLNLLKFVGVTSKIVLQLVEE